MQPPTKAPQMDTLLVNGGAWQVQTPKMTRLGGSQIQHAAGNLDRMATSLQPQEIVVVYFRVTVRQVWGLDVVGQGFNVQWVIDVHWRAVDDDPSLAEGLSGQSLHWRPGWFPTFRVANEKEYLVDTFEQFAVQQICGEDEKTEAWSGAKVGEIWVKGLFKYTISIAEGWGLRMFPFDIQDLNLMILVNSRAVRLLPSVNVKHVSESVRYDPNGCMVPDYYFHDPFAKWRLCRREDLGLDALHVRFYYCRYTTYYVFNVFFIVGLISALGATPWSINRIDVQDRLVLDITLLLVVVAFKQVIAQMVPCIGYLTLLDVYILCNIVLLVVGTVMHGIIGGMIETCDTAVPGQCNWHAWFDMESSLDWDRGFFVIYGVIWILVHILFTFYIFWIYRCPRQRINPAICDSGTIGFTSSACDEPLCRDNCGNIWFDCLVKKRVWSAPLPENCKY